MGQYLFLSFVAGIISFVLIRNSFYVTQDAAIKKNELLLLIGIMSSQNNFEARQSIRDTWLYLTRQENVKYFFLVGKEICNVPPEDRLYKEACIEWTVDMKEYSEFSTGEVDAIKMKIFPSYVGVTFLVHHPIVIRSMNLLREYVAVTDGFVRVSLMNAVTREKIVSATFSNSENSSGSDLVEKTVEPYILPKGFEGQVIVELIGNKSGNISLDHSECWLQWNNGSGLITFLQLIRNVNEKPVPFHDVSCTYACLTFTLHVQRVSERRELQLHIATRNDRQKSWENKMKSLKNKLLKESEEKNDILFLDVVDVYRNLPHKLLHFLKWAHLNEDFSYLLKTDDDTFVNIGEVLRTLKVARKEQSEETFTQPETKLYLHWWSTFREGWPVHSYGKWREDNYRAQTYPPFPCGAGYVLSKDLVQFLGNKAHNFLYQDFQGEDVALGIWLAGVNPLRYSGDKISCTWACDGTCNPKACNRAELSVDAMYETWEAYQNCSNLCGCHWK